MEKILLNIKRYKGLRLILLLPIGILLSYGLSFFPDVVEAAYSNGVYRVINQPLSLVTGFLPFSAAEMLIAGLVVLFIWKLVSAIRRTVKKEGRVVLLRFLSSCIVFAAIIYFLFIILWGLNYHRHPFSQIAGLDIRPASKEELVEVCEAVIERTNLLRSKVNESEKGTMTFPGGYRAVLAQAGKGYEEVASVYPQLGGRYGTPKPVLLSRAMSMTGIWGVYFPFTAEANVNVAIPESMIPSTACHEMAHQRGFAREDEANYIASVACSMHPSVEFQYSGSASSLIHLMNSVYKHDRSEYKRLYEKFSEGVKRDWAEIDEFNNSTEGIVSDISNKINDTYLKANMQDEGVYSYGRMVDLLIAEYRKKSEGK